MTAPANILPQPPSAPSIAVVVPSFNHADFIEQCLWSIFNQQLRPSQLLVIDDGSKDDSANLIAKVLKDSPIPAEFISRSNRGLSATLNEGLSKTQGNYFAYIGSDDIWLPQFLSKRAATLDVLADAVLAYGHGYSIDADNRIIDCSADWAAYVDGDVRRMLLTTLAPLSPTVVYRRSAVERYGWNENAELEDYELYLRLSADGDFAFDPQPLAAWRQHRTNVSANIDLMFRERMAALDRVAPNLGLDQNEVARYRREAMFRNAQEFMRNGQRGRAIEVWRAGGQATSAAEAFKLALGLVTPSSITGARRTRRRKAATQRYGSLNVTA